MDGYQYKSLVGKAADVDLKSRTVKGFFASFNTVDDGGDIIRYGAFAKSLNERGVNSSKPRIKHLLNHNPAQAIGSLVVLEEKAEGLYYESVLGTFTLAQDVLKMYQDGIITEHSIGYQTVKSTQTSDGYRSLDELKLWEGSSLTAWGMNENTPVVKSLDDVNRYINRLNDWEKAVKNGTYSDETIVMLDNMLMQMKAMLTEVISLKVEKPIESLDNNEPKLTEEEKAFVLELNKLKQKLS